MDSKLATKIYNVMCATEALEKDLTVGKPGSTSAYKAVGEATVLNMIKPLFKEQKLILLPKDGEISENLLEYTDGYGKNKLRAITQLKVYFDVIDSETGESTTIIGFGNGADSQDKGSGKAFTYALKTALQKSFMMFSGEDTDNTHSDDIGSSSEKQETNTNKSYSGGVSEKQIKRLQAIAYGKGYDFNSVNKAAKKKYNVDDLKNLTKQQYDEMCTGYENAEKKS